MRVPAPTPRARGFTLVEVVVTFLIAGVLAALGIGFLMRPRERATLRGFAVELNAILHGARATAMADGRDVVVMVFPSYPAPGGATGRLIVYEDANANFFQIGSPVNYRDYDPENPAVEPDPGGVLANDDQVLEIIDLPRKVVVLGALGQPAAAPAQVLAAPWDTLPAAGGCTFCRMPGDAKGDRGAIRFDARGRASFYDDAGVPLGVFGGSFSLGTPADIAGGGSSLPDVKTVAVLGSTGAVRVIDRPFR